MEYENKLIPVCPIKKTHVMFVFEVNGKPKLYCEDCGLYYKLSKKTLKLSPKEQNNDK